MIGQRRLLSVISIVAGSLVCGGVAMAATGGLPGGGAGTFGVHAADVTDPTGSVSSTSVDVTSTSASSDTTNTSAPDDTSMTTMPEVTSTTVNAPATSVPCRPGWGYGDTNHCHSGPPGLANKPPQGGSGSGHPGNGLHGHANNSEHGQHG